jgi:hypothetical protein
MPTEIRTNPEKSPLLRAGVAMDAYCPCEEKGVCGVPAPGAGGAGGPGGTLNGGALTCPSREAIELARCNNPITIKITGQVLPK